MSLQRESGWPTKNGINTKVKRTDWTKGGELLHIKGRQVVIMLVRRVVNFVQSTTFNLWG